MKSNKPKQENLTQRTQLKEDIDSTKAVVSTQEAFDAQQLKMHYDWYTKAGSTGDYTHNQVLATIANLKKFITDYYISLSPSASDEQKYPLTEMRKVDRYCGFKQVNAVYQKALEEGTLVTEHSEDSYWLCMSLTCGDCGVFAIALHLALKAQGIDSEIQIDAGDAHASVYVNHRCYDAVNSVTVDNYWPQKSGVNVYAVAEAAAIGDSIRLGESLSAALRRWIPYDNIGWGICYYFQQCYTHTPVEMKVPCEPTTPLDQVELKNIGQVASSLVAKYKAV